MDPSLPLEPLYEGTVLLSVFEEQALPLTAVGLLLLGIGLLNLYLYRSNEATADRLERTDVTTAGSVTDGPAAVSGIARPAGETVSRPASDGECLAYERDTVTKRESVENNHDTDEQRDFSVETTHGGESKSTAFYIEDDTGTVLVADDETPALHLETTDSETEKPDPEVLEERRRRGSTQDEYTAVIEQNHTYSELFPGDEVFVFGRARSGPSADGGQVESDPGVRITADDETGDFILSHHGKDWLLEEYVDRVQLIIGVVVSVLSAAFLAFIWLA